MIGVVFALFGLACVFYVVLIVAASLAAIIVIAWKMLWAMGREVVLLFINPTTKRRHGRRSRIRQPRSTQPLSKSTGTTTSWRRGRVSRLSDEPNVGNDITIIAGDQTPGKALYSELDPPPHSKLAEN